MKFSLNVNKTVAIINSNGAMIETIKNNGNNLLFPLSFIEKNGTNKIRGGSFPCIPNFGVDELEGLKNHGYGREIKWKLISKVENSITLFTKGQGKYKDLETYLSYSITENSLNMKLKFKNKSNNTLLIAPGFHPYFYSKDSYIKIQDMNFSKKDIENSVFIESENISFETEKYRINYKSKDFKTYIVWSDFENDYICVEPTFNGTSFIKNYKNKPYEIKSKEEREFKVDLNWNIKE